MKMRGGAPGSDMYPTATAGPGGENSKAAEQKKATLHNGTLSLNRHKEPPAGTDAEFDEGQHRETPACSAPAAAETHTTVVRPSYKIQRGNIYYFSRGSRGEDCGKSPTDGPHTPTDATPERLDDQGPGFQSDPDTGPEFFQSPGQSGFSDADTVSGQSDPPASENPPAASPADWMDHPITRALAVYSDIDSPLNPARIIAESLQSFTVPGRPSAEPSQTPEADDPDEMPIRPISPDQSEQSAEIEASAIEARDRFWDFWIGHQEQMRSQCIRLMAGNVADAEDALSSAMLRASKKFPRYSENIVNGKAWLRKLVYNVCMDHYRQGKYTEYRSFDLDTDIPASGAMFTGEQQSPEDIALSHEQIRELDTCLDTLSGNLRVPLLLRCVEGWSYPDIAKQLNLRADTVRKRIQLARDHLRRSNIR